MSLETFLSNVDPQTTVSLRESGPASADAFFAEFDGRPIAPRKVLTYRENSDGHQRWYYVSQFSQAPIFIDLNKQEVSKKTCRFYRLGILKRETDWLRRLSGSARTPEIIDRYGRVIVSNYLGEPVRQHNLPDDWELQAEDILAVLKDASCCHNDIKCDNLVVRDGRISIIDFNWATPAGAPIPRNWPTQLGRQHRIDIHKFDDRRAIYAALRSAMNNKIDHSRISVA